MAHRSTYTKTLIEEMNRYYDERAPWHDEYMGYKSHGDHKKQFASVISLIESHIWGANLLEIACGTGNWTRILAELAASVTATDISPGSLELASAKVAGVKNVRLVKSNAYELANIEGTFDVAFAADWWSHIPNNAVSRFLDALKPKLRAGGTAIFLDMLMKEYFRRYPSKRDDENNRVNLRTLPNGSQFRVVKNFPSRARLADHLAPYCDRFEYFEFAELERWMVVITLNS